MRARGVDTHACFNELQIGHTATQLQTFGLPPNSTASWTIFYKDLAAASGERLFGDSHSDAIAELNRWEQSTDGGGSVAGRGVRPPDLEEHPADVPIIAISQPVDTNMELPVAFEVFVTPLKS